MKKISIFLLTAAALVGAFSCNKNVVAPEQPVLADLPNGSITVNIGAADETKAALTAMKDMRINSVQVFVFDANNRLETDVYKDGLSADNSTQVTINTKTGNKTVYALLNHERLSFTVGSTGQLLADYEAILTDLSQNTSEADLVMTGKNTVNVTDYNNQGAGGTPQAVNIFVKRLVSRIQLDGITVDFRGTSLEGANFTVQKIYLKNVVGKSPIGMQGLTGVSDATSSILPKELPAGEYDIAANLV